MSAKRNREQILLNEKDTLSQEVYNEILARLMDKRLLPGTMLNRRSIAEELGVSVAPVLEAMLQLEIEGFLESVPRKGSFIKSIQLEDVFDQLMLREALECQASRLYCGEPVLNNMDNLIGAAEELDNQLKLDTKKGWEIELQFHHSLVLLANCAPISQAFIQNMRLGLFYQINYIYKSEFHPINKHVDLLEKLCKATPGEAEELIRFHLRSGKDRILNIP